MKRRPTNIPHIPGQRRRSVHVPDLSKGRRMRAPKPRETGRVAFDTRRKTRRPKRGNRKQQSGCGFPFWLIFMGIIAWNVMGDDVDWDWLRDQVRGLESVSDAPADEATPSDTAEPAETQLPDAPPVAQLPPPPPGAGEARAGPSPPRGDLGGLFSASDYPSVALRNGDEGAVRARLTIGVEGRVLDCTVIRSSGHASLDDRTCAIFTERARFVPARDAFGNAVEGVFLTPAVSWTIPE